MSVLWTFLTLVRSRIPVDGLCVFSGLTFGHSEEEAASHQTTPVERRRLDRRDEAPEEDAECTPLVWRELFPAHARPSELIGQLSAKQKEKLMCQVLEDRKTLRRKGEGMEE